MERSEPDAIVTSEAGGDPSHPGGHETDGTAASLRVSRRGFVVGAATGLTAGAVGLPGALAQDPAATPVASPQATPGATPLATPGLAIGTPAASAPAAQPVGLTFFNPYQATIVQAAAARIIPTDEHGPGSTEAGVVYFIDRQLATMWGFSAQRYNQGPFLMGAPTQGDQLALNLRERYRLGVAALDAYAQQLYQAGFAQLSAEQQDRILIDLDNDTPQPFSATAMTAQPFEGAATAPVDPAAQSGIGAKAFFQLLISHTIAGFFADPLHGGNLDMVGWKLIGFPGAHMDYGEHILDYGKPYTGPYISLADDQRRLTGGS